MCKTSGMDTRRSGSRVKWGAPVTGRNSQILTPTPLRCRRWIPPNGGRRPPTICYFPLLYPGPLFASLIIPARSVFDAAKGLDLSFARPAA